jgi:ADP-L-glycero-D-manno-heptose 6-epimerase
MKWVVTGGAGFIGSCLLWKLNQEGISDILVVDHLGSSEKWKNLRGKQFSDYMEKSEFLQRVHENRLPASLESVIHLGACSSTTESDASYLIQNNYGYSKALAEWAVRTNKRFLYASSAATYGAGELGYVDDDAVTPQLVPLNMYGYSKQLFDLWVLQHDLQKRFAGFKFFNVYGPNEYHKDAMRSMVHKGYQQIKQTGAIRLFRSHRPEYPDGGQMRDFVYVKDVLNAVWFFIKHPEKTGIYNLGTGQAHTWNDLAKALFKALGRPPKVEYFDMPAELRTQYQYYTQADVAKLRRAGYQEPAYALEEAVREYVQVLEGPQYL